jgi:hypothetical protein
MAPNQLTFIRQTLYILQRQYGADIDFYHYIGRTTDNVTGDVSVSKTKYRIKKVIRLPDSQIRKVLLGGAYDESEAQFIFSKRYLPRSFVIREEDYFIYRNSRFLVKSTEEWVHGSAYIVTTKSIQSDILEQVLSFSLNDNFIMKQEVNYVQS